jgi:hypothetical protein
LHRTWAKCNHCNKTFTTAEAKVEQLRDHILYHCTDVPKEVREQWEQRAAKGRSKSMSGEKAVAAGVKRTRQSDIRRALPSRDWELTDNEVEEVNHHFLRFLVTSNVAFNAVDNPHLHAALAKLRPQYQLPSPYTFRVQLLEQEYLGVIAKLKEKIGWSQNLTLAVDGWTDALKRSIFAFVLQFPDRTAHLLASRQAFADKHIGEFIAGVYTV